jgi:hypothetical protein
MTRLAERKTRLQFETSARYRGVALVALPTPHDLILREKGRRTAFAVPWLAVYELAMKLAANEARRLKLERRACS